MATTAASQDACRGWLALSLLLAGCPRAEVGGLPEVASAEPEIRVGLVVAQPEVSVGGGGPLLLSGPDGGGLTELGEGQSTVVSGTGATVRARLVGVLGEAVTEMTIRPVETSGTVRVGNREYRGAVVVTAKPTGVLAVNLLPIDAYVAGVVNAEMGRRPAADSEAVYAQAVISRTVAMRALGRYRIRGYDVVGTISDQAYGGVQSETEMGWAAVRATAGEVITAGGAVIEAFFSSTCGGRTEAVEEVFSGTGQSYLRSVSDRDPSGQAYCAISPRFRWREEWSGEALGVVLRANASVAGLDPATVLNPADLQVSGRSVSGRVAELIAVAGGRAQAIRGQQSIRQVLRGADGGWLRSTQFSVQVTRAGGRIVRLTADGAGNGHGVGMCQWGAVGRARAGASYREILAAYFPGTEIQRLF